MHTPASLEVGSTITVNSISYTVKKRKNPTPKKPSLFIVRTGGGYGSSLYSTQENGLWALEIANKRYLIRLGDLEAKPVRTEHESRLFETAFTVIRKHGRRA